MLYFSHLCGREYCNIQYSKSENWQLRRLYCQSGWKTYYGVPVSQSSEATYLSSHTAQNKA